jgi:type II secretory ATPase GspE/PulE/Tfp pilus assembly ATPase PilB-like protein
MIEVGKSTSIDLTYRIIDYLEEKGVLRKSYAEVFRKIAKTPKDILFSNTVNPEKFALAVSEITGIPYEENPQPKQIKKSRFRSKGEEGISISEMFSELKVPLRDGRIGILYPLPQHFSQHSGELVVISLNNFKKIISHYVLSLKTPADVERLLEENNLSNALFLILVKAVALEASDIHIDPFEEEGICSFRIEGDIEVFCSLKGKGEGIIRSLFTVAGISSDRINFEPTSLRLSGETLIKNAQDPKNKISAKTQDFLPILSGVDFRIEVAPAERGITVVIRILDKSKTFWELEKIGLQESIVEKLKATATKRGILLVTGETGSGKTTTCYSILSTIDAIRKKIITIEDPVELQNPFWRQFQYREGGDYQLSFENLLASILRQDPDVIFVGEVRNAQTALLLFQAANTGHAVLSTIHTNSISTTSSRENTVKRQPLNTVWTTEPPGKYCKP